MTLRVPATAMMIEDSSRVASAMFRGKYFGASVMVCSNSTPRDEKSGSCKSFHILIVPSDAPVTKISEFGNTDIRVIGAWCPVSAFTNSNSICESLRARHKRSVWSAAPLRSIVIADDRAGKNFTALTTLEWPFSIARTPRVCGSYTMLADGII